MAYKQVGMIKKNWITKPPLGSVVDTSHPLAKSLVGAWIFNEGGGLKLNSLTNRYPEKIVPNTNSGWATTPKGLSYHFDNTAYTYSTPPVFTKDITIIVTYSIQSFYGASEYWVAGYTDSLTSPSAYDKSIVIVDATKKAKFHCYDGSNKDIISNTVTTVNTIYTVVAVKRGGNLELYVNGKSDATPVASGDTYANNVYFTSSIGGIGTLLGNVISKMLYSRALSPSEIQQLYINPYGFIVPTIRRTYVQIGGEPPVTNRLTRRRIILSCN